MKISIITLHTVKNYGSVLQAYATQKKFEKMGCEVEIIDYWRRDNIDSGLLKQYLKDSDKWNRNFLTRTIFMAIKAPSVLKKIKIFNHFLKDRIRLTKRRYYSLEELKTDVPEADIYCTGSDQMWNSDWNSGIERPFFLEYAPKDKPCISYSTSFGKPELESSEKEETKKLLARYDAISVRENSGLKVLQSLGIEGGIQLPDPTIILSQEDWQDIIAPRLVKRPYVLVYQLNKNEKADRYIETFSKLKGMRLVRISYDYNHFFKAGLLFCCPKVEEFLSLIYYADYILTDSFHGAAFSINFNKKFAVFYPPRFSTRLQSILELTGLNDRVIEFKDLTIPDRTINYERINYILNEERAKADAFLKSTLRANHVTIGDAQ